MDKRYQQALAWLQTQHSLPEPSLSAASADASFRRYFRVHSNNKTYILMDAPPDKEDSSAFVTIAEALAQLGVHVPAIYSMDLSLGFLLLEDLGSTPYLDELNKQPNKLYSNALNALIKIQQGDATDLNLSVDNYNQDKLQTEMDLFAEWFVQRHFGIELNSAELTVLHSTQQRLIEACLEQPQVWVHRDYHSRNLMVTKENSPGVIDFQDLVNGPIAYDLASLLKDCYIAWPRSQQLDWLEEYYTLAVQNLNLPHFGFDELIRWFDLTGLQRHIKVLGIFCRLNYRDGKANYLKDLPLVAEYILEVLKLYPELEAFENSFAPIIERAIV